MLVSEDNSTEHSADRVDGHGYSNYIDGAVHAVKVLHHDTKNREDQCTTYLCKNRNGELDPMNEVTFDACLRMSTHYPLECSSRVFTGWLIFKLIDIPMHEL
jgi:hypothetical protein